MNSKIFAKKWNFDQSKLKPDCGECDALCCIAPRFEILGYNKPAGRPCKNLEISSFRCDIFDHLEDEGFSFCRAFDCLGAGVAVSQLFRQMKKTWPSDLVAGKAELEVFTFVFGFLSMQADPEANPTIDFDPKKLALLEDFIEAALLLLTYDIDDVRGVAN